MRTSLGIVFVAAAGWLLLAAGQAGAAAGHPVRATTVTVVMHDPGCHWFSVGGKLRKTLSVKGPVALLNVDEAALKVAGPSGVKRDAVGKKIVLSRGSYRITMVGQAPDDNILRLTVK
jgi:hypothetical protein